MHLNPHTIGPMICLVMAMACGIYVLKNNPHATLNRIFFFICVDIMAWMSYYVPMNFNVDEHIILIWMRASYCFICFIPIMCFTFLSTYLNIPKNLYWYRINSSIGIALCCLCCFSNVIVAGVRHLPWFSYPSAGPLHFLLILHCGSLAIFSLKIIFEGLRNVSTSPKAVNHLKYMCTGIMVLTFGMTDFLGNYGIPVYNVGPYANIIFLSIVTTAIIKHQLMDIQVAIKKGLVYSFLVSAITIVYLLIVLLLEHLFSNYMRWHELTGSLLSAAVIAIIFIPLRDWLQRYVDRLIFKNTTPEIAEQNELLRQEVISTEKYKAVATLASGMAHEIKNPLTALKTFSEYLPGKLDDKQFLQKFAPLVNQEVSRIDNLVHDLLDFAKPTQAALKPTRVIPLIDSVLGLLGNDFQKHQIELTSKHRHSPDLSPLLDENHFRQALLNILLNSIDAMPNGGKLTVTTTIGGGAFHLMISDTGIGIPSTELAHIFEPFYSKKKNGTGLGLSITKRIIEQHGGTVSVKSKPGKGTHFLITIRL